MYVFSIIIPHYNVPALLERCVDSIPMREDVQVIVVDDCSPASEELNATFQRLRRRKNLELYVTPQGGSAGRARNVGLDHAKGKWLLFADADDFFDASISVVMDGYADATEDVLFFNHRSVMSEDITKVSSRKSEENDPFEDIKKTGDESYFRFHFHVPWSKMVNRGFVETNGIRFDETRYANDAMFSVLVGCKAKTIKAVDIPVYVYTEREGSLCSGFCSKPGEAAIRAKVALRLYKVIREHKKQAHQEYIVFLRCILWNKEFHDYFAIYHTNSDFGISKRELRRIACRTGWRYYMFVLWLISKELWCSVKGK